MYKRILIPVDGSIGSNKALVAGIQLARESGGRARLVHVMDGASLFTGFDPQGTHTPDLLGALREHAMKVLNEASDIARAAGVPVDQSLCDNGKARLGEAVANAAKLWNADLIVTGSHGRHGVGRVLLGSGAEQIMRMAPVPVLVVRAD